VSVGVRGGPEGDDGLMPGASTPGPVALFPHMVPRPVDATWLQAIVARHPRSALAVKRLVDVAVAALGLIVTAPLLAVLAFVVWLDAGSPAFYRQLRTGRKLRPFTLTKLRTMHDDGRVTRVGRLLRPTGLDELPQLWNVLKGDMSLVGPRPEQPHLVYRYDAEVPGYAIRHLMRPGITGWAQVNGLRGQVSIAERLSYDLRYLRSWSLVLDCRIFLRTATTVWRDSRRAWKR